MRVKEPQQTSTFSPGPGGYNLPTGVGKNGHDPTRKMAPSFSFGSRYSKFTDQSPGPVYMVDSRVTYKGKGFSPRYTLTNRWNPKKITFVTPAPGAYNASTDLTETTRYKKPPRFSFGSKLDIDNKTAGPGPCYMVPESMGSNSTGSRAAVLVGKTEKFGYSHDYANTPGPASNGGLIGSDVTLRRPPAFSMQGRGQIPVNKLVTPAPGSYNMTSFGNNSSPRFSIGIRHAHKSLSLADVSD